MSKDSESKGGRTLKKEFMYQTRDILNQEILRQIRDVDKPAAEIDMPFSVKNFRRTVHPDFFKGLNPKGYQDLMESKIGEDSLCQSTSIIDEDEKDFSPSRKSISVPSKDIAQIQSVTKFFTSVLAMRMSEEGIIDLDRPIRDYIDSETLATTSVKNFDEIDQKEEPPITMRDILSHRSGLVFKNGQTLIDKSSDKSRKYETKTFLLADLALEGAAREFVMDHLEDGQSIPEIDMMFEDMIKNLDEVTIGKLMDNFVLRPPEGSKTNDEKNRPRFDSIFCPKSGVEKDCEVPVYRVMPSFSDDRGKIKINSLNDLEETTRGFLGRYPAGYKMLGSTEDLARFNKELWEKGSILSEESRLEMMTGEKYGSKEFEEVMVKMSSEENYAGHGFTYVTKVDGSLVMSHLGEGDDCIAQTAFIAAKTDENGLPISGISFANASTFVAIQHSPNLEANAQKRELYNSRDAKQGNEFSQKISLDDLDLAKPEEKESKEMPKEKSWVEKMADRKLSTSRDGHREI